MSKENFQKRLAQIATDSSHIRNVCVQSQFHDGRLIADKNERLASIEEAAAQSPLFEGLGEHAGGVATAWGTAIHEYVEAHGHMPSDEMLASAASSLRNITELSGPAGNNKLLESVKKSIETTEGQEFRARQAGLILPVLLMASTSDAATFIPAGANETEIFRIRRVAGSTFGDYQRGDEIGEFSHGQYTQMDQLYAFPEDQQPDGTKKSFTYDSSAAGPKIKVPFYKGSIKVMVDRRECVTEAQQEGKLFGIAKRDGKEYTCNGTVDYRNGTVAVTTDTALPAGARLHLAYDVDIEAQPELIPTITHTISSVTLRPHQAVIAAEHTIQAYWMLNREFALDLKSMQMSQMRNLLAYDKDIKNLRKMTFAASHRDTFDLTIPDGLAFREHWEMLARTLSDISSRFLIDTKVSGLVGLYCGTKAASVLKALGSPNFVPVANYRQVPRVHYVGTLFGLYKVFEVPVEIEAVKGDPSTKLGMWDCLCYARGESHTDAGIVNGDAVSATMFNHTTSKELKDRSTLWELAYCDIHPDNGPAFFSILSLLPASNEPHKEVKG